MDCKDIGEKTANMIVLFYTLGDFKLDELNIHVCKFLNKEFNFEKKLKEEDLNDLKIHIENSIQNPPEHN